MWRRRLIKLLLIIAGVTVKLLKIIWSMIIKGLRIVRQSRLRRPLMISLGIICITAIIVLSITGIFNYIPDTSTPFPYIPSFYVSCTEVLPLDLLNAYQNSHLYFGEAEKLYNEKVYIFKQIQVTENMLKWRADGYVWVENIIQCYPLDLNQLDHLKIDDIVDIIGISMGQHEQFRGLVFRGCIFPPSGTIQLPLEDNSEIDIINY